MNKKIKEPLNQEMHFRDALTITNLIPVLRKTFPELKETFVEFELQSSEYDQDNFSCVFIPFLINFLTSNQKNPITAQRIFHFLEKMARSQDFQVVNILTVVILESLPPKQLEVAKKYMEPKTKEVLRDLEEYLKALFSKK